ncbi:MAG: hypothetical protein JXR23_03895 [Pontiellaceae bacterium]|nr:hypothetical protein [Pontiellaceae bacterium]
MKLGRVLASTIVFSFLFIYGCSTDKTILDFDGVYDAVPFTCMGLCPVHMLIENGQVSFYNTDHSTLEHAGIIEGNLWKIWKDKPILVASYDNGITMQVIGHDSFIELPRLEMTADEFKSLNVSMENSLTDFLDFMEDPLLVMGSGANESWKCLRLIHEGYCSDSASRLFNAETSYDDGIITAELIYTGDSPTKISASPTEIDTEIFIVEPDGGILQLRVYCDNNQETIHLEKGDALVYRIDLNDFTTYGDIPGGISEYFKPGLEYGIICRFSFSLPKDYINSSYLRAVINDMQGEPLDL